MVLHYISVTFSSRLFGGIMKKVLFFIALVTSSIFIVSCSKKQVEQSVSNNTDSQESTNMSTQELTPTPSATSEDSTNKNVDHYLCSEDEELLFSFQIADSNKSASICTSKNQQEYIIYRYGTKDKVELEYPEKTEASWDLFTYSYCLRGGGKENEGLDLNYLSFENGGYTYEIYDEYSAVDDKHIVGIKVTNQETNEETDILGDSDSMKGSLISLRDNAKINNE